MGSRATALVTGAAGFLGSHLVDRLLSEGFRVVGLDNLSTGDLTNLERASAHPHFSFVSGDVREPISAAVDVVFHLACPGSPRHFQRDRIGTILTNVQGAAQVVDLVRGNIARGRACPVVFASTGDVYGDAPRQAQAEGYWGNVDPTGPRACHDESKRCAETLLADATRMHGLDVRIARVFATYGPRMPFGDGRVVSSFIVHALRGEALRITGSGRQIRTFCYVDDMIDGLIQLGAADADPPLGPVNLGEGQPTTIANLAEMVLTEVGCRTPTDRMMFGSDAESKVARRVPDLRRARAILGFCPKIPLAEGLSRTVDDFRARMAALGEPVYKASVPPESGVNRLGPTTSGPPVSTRSGSGVREASRKPQSQSVSPSKTAIDSA